MESDTNTVVTIYMNSPLLMRRELNMISLLRYKRPKGLNGHLNMLFVQEHVIGRTTVGLMNNRVGVKTISQNSKT